MAPSNRIVSGLEEVIEEAIQVWWSQTCWHQWSVSGQEVMLARNILIDGLVNSVCGNPLVVRAPCGVVVMRSLVLLG